MALQVDGLRWLGVVVVTATLGAIVTTLAAYASRPLLVVALVAFGVLCVATYLRPVIGVAAALLFVAAETVPIPIPFSPTEATMIAVAVCWALHALRRPGSVALPSVRDLPVLALLVSTGAGLALADEKDAILRVTALWILFYLVYLQCQTFTAEEIRTVLVAFAVGAGVVGAVGVLAYLQTGPPQLYGGGLGTGARAAGAFGDPNYSASIIALALVPAIGLLVLEPRRLWWLIPVLAVAAAGVLFSLSRGGTLALVAGVAVLTLWGRFRIVGAVVVLVVLAVGLVNAEPITRSAQFSTVRDRLGTLSGSGLSVSLRPRIWAAAVDTGLDSPVFGVGVENFRRAAAQRGIFERGTALENVHNIPLNFLAENGFVGLVGFVLFAGQVLARGVIASQRAGPLARALGLGMLASTVGFYVQGATLSSLRVNAIAAAFFVIAGMVTALADRARTRSDVQPSGAIA